MVKYHLIILVHGLWGNSSHLNYIQSQIAQHIKPIDSEEKIIIYKTSSHPGYLTYDGIDINGKRIVDEIMNKTNELSKDNNEVIKFSIIGYSLGGLLSRYAIGILHSENYFENIKALNFITFCTPHVGIYNPNNDLCARLFNNIVPYLLAYTGNQLFLKDTNLVKTNKGNAYIPLLVWMANPNSFFFKALSNFKYKSLYANIINDKRLPWYTSAISDKDPFDSAYNKDSQIYDLFFILAYEPTIIDYSKSLNKGKVLNLPVNKNIKIQFDFLKQCYKILNLLKNLGYEALFNLLWIIWFASSSLIAKIKLYLRVFLFFRNKKNDLFHLYNHQTDDDDLSDSDSNNNLLSDESETVFDRIEQNILNRVDSQTDSLIGSVYGVMNSEKYENYISNGDNGSINDEISCELNLTKNEIYIINQLNSLEWNKYPILIRNTKATHACCIVRQNHPNFEEGKIVIKHFINEVFNLD